MIRVPPETEPREQRSGSHSSSGRPTGRDVGSQCPRPLKRREHIERRWRKHHRIQRKPAAGLHPHPSPHQLDQVAYDRQPE
jgi:hypothetical protein